MWTGVLLVVLAATAHADLTNVSISGCGQTPVKPNLSTERIVGGQAAVPYSWPWQVVLCKTEWFGGCSLECGGSVLDNGWVMVAAQCIYDDQNTQNYKVKAAVYKEDASNESGEQISNVKSIKLHPNYDWTTLKYDIALIELATPLKYSDHVQPICLPTDDSAVIAKPNSAYLTGWGPTTAKGDRSIELHQVKLPFLDYDSCKKEFVIDDLIDDKIVVCAGTKDHNACYGDRGSPMVVKGSSGAWFQVGISSWGRGCDQEGETGVYTRVSAFCDFISATTSGKVSCQPVA